METILGLHMRYEMRLKRSLVTVNLFTLESLYTGIFVSFSSNLTYIFSTRDTEIEKRIFFVNITSFEFLTDF